MPFPRLNPLILGSALIAAVALSVCLPNRASVALLGGAGGMTTGLLISRKQQQHFQRQALEQEQSFKQEFAEVAGQVAALQAQIAALQTELKQFRNQRINGITTQTSAKLTLKSNGKAFKLPAFVVPQAAIDWFAANQIKLESHWKPNAAVDPVFDGLALFLGDYYSVLACFYAEMKRALHSKTRLRFSLKGKCPEEINRCTQFCTLLKERSVAHNYQYAKEKKFIQVELHYREDIRRFIDGEWLERYVYLKLNQFFQAEAYQHQSLRNPRILFPNGDRAELDLFWLVEGKPLWIECKTSKDYDAFLKKYSDYRNRLGIPPARSILLVLDSPAELIEQRSQFWQLTIGTIDNLIDLVNHSVQEAYSEQLLTRNSKNQKI